VDAYKVYANLGKRLARDAFSEPSRKSLPESERHTTSCRWTSCPCLNASGSQHAQQEEETVSARKKPPVTVNQLRVWDAFAHMNAPISLLQ
jgi:hypothetical protein